MVICDTNVVIEFLKGNEKTREDFKKIGINNLALSAITVMEIYYGAINKRELVKLKQVLSNFTIFNLNEEITATAIYLIEQYAKSHGLDIPDALIASTALNNNLTLWTYNLKDFRFIKNLILFDFT